MVFSKNIIKLGKAEILNGIVDRSDIITLYYSKSNNKVYKKVVCFNNRFSVDASDEALNYTEILPVNEKMCLSRNGESVGIIYE